MGIRKHGGHVHDVATNIEDDSATSHSSTPTRQSLGIFFYFLFVLLGLVFLYAPRNWSIWYPCACLVIFGIVLASYFVLRYLLPDSSSSEAASNLEDNNNNNNKFSEINYVGFLVPASLVLVLFVSNNVYLNWVAFFALLDIDFLMMLYTIQDLWAGLIKNIE